MQIYSLPEDLPAPDMMSFTTDQICAPFGEKSEYDLACDEHEAKVVAWAKENGFAGKNTGRRYREPIADGYANYVMIETSKGAGRKSGMVHLPYGDGWHARTLPHMSKKDVLAEMDRQEKFDAVFSKKGDVA